jgi:hypothetical protein
MATLSDLKDRTPHDPILMGNNASYMVVSYYPVDALKKILPAAMSIPSDKIMAESFPEVKKIEGMHPFVMLFSHCENVHDVMTNIELRPYQELMFYIPVIYTHKTEQQLCSYVPVLYLDFLIGTIGGCYLGLRKQYHPNMKVQSTATSKSYFIKNTLDVSFQQTKMQDVYPFFTQVLHKPTATVSYFNSHCFYTTRVDPIKTTGASARCEWRYKGSVLTNADNDIANYSEYSFTTSQAMSYQKYFHPDYAL